MIRVATAFSGGLAAAEFALRYEEIEHEVVFACEWDKYARQQYLHFHGEPTSNFYEDIQELDATPYCGEIDLFVFGSPCQDLSLAGKRKGFLGEKSSLFRHGARVLEEMKPKVFIFENVKGLLSSNGGADYKEVVETFQELGYLIASKVMNTKDYGVPQNRERVFIVGFLDADDYHRFSFEDGFDLETRLRDILDIDVDDKYYLSDKFIEGSIPHKERHQQKGNGFAFEPKGEDDIASCLSTKYGNRQTDTYIRLNQVGTLDIKGFESMKRVYGIDGLYTCITTRASGSTEPKILQKARGYNKGGEHSVCPTITTSSFQYNNFVKVSSDIKPSVRENFIRDYEQIIKSDKPVFYSDCKSGYQDNKVCLTESACLRANNDNLFCLDWNYKIRKLTPRECYKLQGVRDNCIDLVVSDTQAYKIAGNAISVNVMQSLLRSLYKPAAKDTLF